MCERADMKYRHMYTNTERVAAYRNNSNATTIIARAILPNMWLCLYTFTYYYYMISCASSITLDFRLGMNITCCSKWAIHVRNV